MKTQRRNPFMTPEYTNEVFATGEDKYGDYIAVPWDYRHDQDWSEEGFEKESGWWAQLSAPGYMDQTGWSGPFDTLKEAKQYIEDTFEVDPESGESLFEENPRVGAFAKRTASYLTKEIRKIKPRPEVTVRKAEATYPRGWDYGAYIVLDITTASGDKNGVAFTIRVGDDEASGIAQMDYAGTIAMSRAGDSERVVKQLADQVRDHIGALKNPYGSFSRSPVLTKKGQRMVEDIEEEGGYGRRTPEVAYRTVYARAKERPGTGLVRSEWAREHGYPDPRPNPAVDEHAVRELALYIENDSDIYHRHTMPVFKNLSRKWHKGTFDASKAPQAFSYVVEAGAKKYVKDFGGGVWHKVFPKSVRDTVAQEMAAEFVQEAELGNLYED